MHMQVRMICPLSRMAKLGQDTSTRPKSASSGTNAGRKGVSKPPAPRFRHLHDLFERVRPPPRPKFAARSRRSFLCPLMTSFSQWRACVSVFVDVIAARPFVLEARVGQAAHASRRVARRLYTSRTRFGSRQGVADLDSARRLVLEGH